MGKAAEKHSAIRNKLVTGKERKNAKKDRQVKKVLVRKGGSTLTKWKNIKKRKHYSRINRSKHYRRIKL